MRHRLAAAFLLVASLLTPLSALAQCADWLLGPFDNSASGGGSDGTIQCAAYWDPDADGPLPTRLVVGGTFNTIGGVAAQHVAWRDPSTGTWNAFGGGVACNVYAITVYNGQVVVGGGGDSDPGSTDNNLLRWDGSTWTTFYGGTSTGSVFALAVYNGQLYAGGSFVIYPAVLNPAYRIARWNAGAGLWESVDSGTDDDVRALYVWQGQLFVGGSFTHAGGQSANFIATWDGAWHALPSEPQGTIMDLSPGYDGELLAIGTFRNASNNAAPGVAGWTGSSWNVRPIQSSSNNLWYTVSRYAGSIYAGGYFTTIDGSAVPHIARWNGSNWVNVDLGVDGPVLDLIDYNNELLAVGSFSTAGSVSAADIARWNGSEWGAFGGGSANGVQAMTVYRGRVVAGGNFHQYAGSGPSAHFIAGWNGTSGLSAFGTGMDNPVMALCAYTTGSIANQSYELVAGGTFTTAGGVACSRVARWIEKSVAFPAPAWAAMGAGFNGPVYAIERFSSATYAGGSFSLSGATSTPNIARWNNAGAVWENIGTFNGPVYALKTYNGYLYAGGAFTTAGGVTTGGLARWNGSAWSACGGNFLGTVMALEVFDGRLAIGGSYPGLSGSPNLAQYDGTFYYTLGTGGASDIVRTLRANGTRLYVGGDFTSLGGLACQFIGYWDGSWHSMPGANQKFLTLAVYNGELHAGGYFTAVDGGALVSPNWARYSASGTPWLATQPVSKNVQPGTTVSFSVTVPPGYTGWTIQWTRNGAPLADGPTGHGSTISGAQTTTLTIQNTNGQQDWGQYRATLTHACGNVQSQIATLSFDGYADVEEVAPTATVLLSLGPNPSRGVATLQYALAKESAVRMRVLDVAGRSVAARDIGRVAAGRHAVAWDTRDESGARVAPGLYLVSLEVDGERVGARRLVVTQ